MTTLTKEIELIVWPWMQWQEAVVELLRKDFHEALHHIRFDEVD